MEHTILVVEDNREMLQNIVAILQLAQYNVITAADGRMGIASAQQFNPDLIICDILMPELDGFGLLHLLRKERATSNIPVIFLTAKTDKADIRKGMNLGADDYITKPFDGLELLNAVEMRLKRKSSLNVTFQHGINEFRNLTDKRVAKRYKKREPIYLEGQFQSELYFVKSGKVKTFKTNGDGKELVLNFHRPGDFIGHVPLIEDSASTEGAVALEETELYVIPKEEFLTMLYSRRDVAYKFIRLLSSNLQQVEERMVELAYHSVRQKVAAALIRVYDRYESSNGKNPPISVSRKDLSNLIGAATESLNRTLLDFKEEGLIEIRGDGIRILSYTRMEEEIR